MITSNSSKKGLFVSGKSMQSLQKIKNIVIPALKRGEIDVGSYLQKDTAKSLFHLQNIRFLLKRIQPSLSFGFHYDTSSS